LILISLTTTPWLTFLDPDDEFTGDGMPEALQVAKDRFADIVQFACIQISQAHSQWFRCWREPRFMNASGTALVRAVARGKADWHMHRKVYRTSVVKRGISLIPSEFRNLRICRHEDLLQFMYIAGFMRGMYYRIDTLGEFRYSGLRDNSMSAIYESANATIENFPVICRALQQMWDLRRDLNFPD
jgi:hypothetical protein